MKHLVVFSSGSNGLKLLSENTEILFLHPLLLLLLLLQQLENVKDTSLTNDHNTFYKGLLYCFHCRHIIITIGGVFINKAVENCLHIVFLSLDIADCINSLMLAFISLSFSGVRLHFLMLCKQVASPVTVSYSPLTL